MQEEEPTTTTQEANVENPLNKDDGTLPFGYYCPASEGKLVWICGEDGHRKITSVFVAQTPEGQKKECSYLKDMTEARKYRDTLVNDGWKKLDPPKVEFTMPDENGVSRPMNRQQKRALARKIKSAKRDIGQE
jgi:hypothetical protein